MFSPVSALHGIRIGRHGLGRVEEDIADPHAQGWRWLEGFHTADHLAIRQDRRSPFDVSRLGHEAREPMLSVSA